MNESKTLEVRPASGFLHALQWFCLWEGWRTTSVDGLFMLLAKSSSCLGFHPSHLPKDDITPEILSSLQHYPSFLLKLIIPIEIQAWYFSILKSINQKTSLDLTPPPTTDPLCSSLWNKTWKSGLSSLLTTPPLSFSYPIHDSVKTVPVGSNSDCHIAKCSGRLWGTILLDLSVAFDTTVHLLRLDILYPSHLVFPLPHWFLLSLFALLLPLYCLPTQVLCLDPLPWQLPDYSLRVVTPKCIPLPEHLSADTTLPFWCLIDYSFPTFTKLHSCYFVSRKPASLSLPYLWSFFGYTFRRVILDAPLTVYIQHLRKSYWLYFKNITSIKLLFSYSIDTTMVQSTMIYFFLNITRALSSPLLCLPIVIQNVVVEMIF